MNRKLEKFVLGNRAAFDDKDPAPKVWANIESAISKKKEAYSFFTPVIKWSIAAAVALAMGTGIYFFSKGIKVTTDPTASTKPLAEPDINTLAPEAAPQMNAFAKMIETKQEELKVMASEQPELYQSFAKDIDQLDSTYARLKDQLSVTPNKEMLVEAMIQNLQLQINVLNQQLNIIHEIKQSKKDNHEKNAQSI